MIQPFDQITEYCERNNKSVIVRNHAVCIFLSVFKDVSGTPENQTPTRLKASKAALLTEQSIAGYVSRAESILEEYNQALIEPYKNTEKHSFLKNVAASILGSVVFTTIIILFFYLGKEQIQTWLQNFK